VRRVFHIAAALSLVACAAVAVSWVLSYRPGVAALDEFPDGTWGLEHRRGLVRLVVPLGRREAGPEVIPFPPKNLAPGESSSWSLGGVAMIRSPNGDAMRVRDLGLDESATRRRFRAAQMDTRTAGVAVARVGWQTGRRSIGPVDTDARPAATFRQWGSVLVPYPHLFVAAAALPACWMIGALRRRRRVAAGLCRRCGYDLRATPGVCPECGTPAAVTGR
jgi:hypothetical protein